MGRDAVERKCGDTTYKVMPMQPKLALRLLGKLGKLVGPALGQLADGFVQGAAGDRNILDMDTSELKDLSISRVAAELFDRWDDIAVEEIIDDLAKVSFFKAGEGWPRLSEQFDVHFTGRLPDMAKWLVFALEVQYGDFFGGSGEVISFLAQRGKRDTA